MQINWKVRLKNKVFWISLIPLVCVFVKEILALFGIEINLDGVANQLVDLVETLFTIIGLFGIVIDPTTSGISDSNNAMTYEEPKVD